MKAISSWRKARAESKPILYLYWLGDIDRKLNKKCTRTITMIPSADKLSIMLTNDRDSTFPILHNELMNEDKPDHLPDIESRWNLTNPRECGQNATIYRLPNQQFVIVDHHLIQLLVNNKEISNPQTIHENNIISFGYQIYYITQSGELQTQLKFLNFKVRYTLFVCDFFINLTDTKILQLLVIV